MGWGTWDTWGQLGKEKGTSNRKHVTSMKRNTTKPATASYGRSTALGLSSELPWLAECHLRQPEPTKRIEIDEEIPEQAFLIRPLAHVAVTGHKSSPVHEIKVTVG